MTRAVSTWSLHRTLGRYIAPDSAALGGALMDHAPREGGLPLIDLPRELAAHGYDTLQIVHFHLPSRSPDYLAQLRQALADAGVTLDALLIDDGDLTDAANADRIEAWIDEWLGVAEALGARRARLIVGRSEPTPERVADVATRLKRLAAAHPGVRIVIENWLGMFPDAAAVHAVLDQVGDAAGLLVDLGNWTGPGKYAELEQIAGRAETCHAKCTFTGEEPDAEDFTRCLAILRDAGFDGPLALIYDGPNDDEWAKLDVEYGLTQEVFAGAR